MKRLFNFLALLFALLFVWAAALQWNDPDALVWIVIYGYAALLLVLFLLGRLSFGLALLSAIVYFGGVFYAWPAKFEGFTIGAGDIKNIEEGREACGLLIVALVLLMFALRIKFGRKS